MGRRMELPSFDVYRPTRTAILLTADGERCLYPLFVGDHTGSLVQHLLCRLSVRSEK